MIRLASQQARAWAAVGDASAVEHALTVARQARDAMTPNPAEIGVFLFNPGKSAYYAAEARLALGRPDDAHRAITDALEASALLTGEAQPSAELVAAARLDLTAAHLAAGDLDAAQEVLPNILDLPAERWTVPVVERTAKIGRTLADPRFAASGISRDLRERVSLFVAYPAATRELAA